MTGSAAEVAAALRERQSFVLTSHARPDGDAIGSQLALALALDALGKRVRVVYRDPMPAPYRGLPGVERIEIADRGQRPCRRARSCSSAATSPRPEVAGLDATSSSTSTTTSATRCTAR